MTRNNSLQMHGNTDVRFTIQMLTCRKKLTRKITKNVTSTFETYLSLSFPEHVCETIPMSKQAVSSSARVGFEHVQGTRPKQSSFDCSILTYCIADVIVVYLCLMLVWTDGQQCCASVVPQTSSWRLSRGILHVYNTILFKWMCIRYHPCIPHGYMSNILWSYVPYLFVLTVRYFWSVRIKAFEGSVYIKGGKLKKWHPCRYEKPVFEKDLLSEPWQYCQTIWRKISQKNCSS